MTTPEHAAMTILTGVLKDFERNLHHCDSYHNRIDAVRHLINKIDKGIVRQGWQQTLMVCLPDLARQYDQLLKSRSGTPVYFEASHDVSKSMAVTLRCLSTCDCQYDFSGRPGLDTDPTTIFLIRTLLSLFKKVVEPCSPDVIKESVLDFLKIEQETRMFSMSWNSDQLIGRRETFHASYLRGELDHFPRGERLWKTVDQVFGRLIPQRMLFPEEIIPRHGPGAVSDLRTGSDKYTFPYWPEKLDQTFPRYAFAQHRDGIPENQMWIDGISSKEPPAKLIAVPKTIDKPRLIASEPTAHQFIQQGLMRWLRLNMTKPLSNCVDFLSQEPSKALAKESSFTGAYSTIDLSSASDRLSCWAVERAFSGNLSLLRALHASRTRTVVDGTGTYDFSIRIKKFAAQGSAVTFPIQTIVYAGLCIAALAHVNGVRITKRSMLRLSREVRVFGDDIIVPNVAAPLLAHLLGQVGLKVNMTKSCVYGPFRESCGMDGYEGYDVTPFRVTTLGKSPSRPLSFQWAELSSNAWRKGLWHTSLAIESLVNENSRRRSLVTRDDGDGLRFLTNVEGFSTSTKVKYCDRHHVFKARLLVQRSANVSKERESWQSLLQYLLEAPEPDVKWASGYMTRKADRVRTAWVVVD